MEEKIYVIINHPPYDDTTICGYIKGTEADAEKWCEEYNAKCKNWFDEVYYEELKNLKENNSKE